MARARKPKRLGCRYCGSMVDVTSADHASAFTHGHPSECSYRTDRVPALNGVHVGDLWRNLHTLEDRRVHEIRLGGDCTYTDREPTVLLAPVDADPHDFAMPHPLWSLVEHWEPLTRPDCFAVPSTPSERFPTGRSAADEWRCPGHRRVDGDDERDRAYFHAWHVARGYCSERWGAPWLYDPDAEASLFDSPAIKPKPTPIPEPAPAPAQASAGEQLALL
jgi:hypothetical protein